MPSKEGFKSEVQKSMGNNLRTDASYIHQFCHTENIQGARSWLKDKLGLTATEKKYLQGIINSHNPPDHTF